eukprot:COSAG02_NODE_3947_length_5998_cov_201.978464_3_plen_56_part_00
MTSMLLGLYLCCAQPDCRQGILCRTTASAKSWQQGDRPPSLGAAGRTMLLVKEGV